MFLIKSDVPKAKISLIFCNVFQYVSVQVFIQHDSDINVINYLLITEKEHREEARHCGHAIWAVSLGTCNFTIPREPPAFTYKTLGEGNPRKTRAQ